MTFMPARYQQINKVVLLPVDKIDPNPLQPRRIFEPTALRSLADSIAENGLINPVTVRSSPGGRFELIAGERRLQATRLLGESHIGAIVEQVDDQSSAVAAMVENLQRQQLGFFEEAAGIEALIKTQNITQQRLADRLGVAQSTVANKLRLLRLPGDAQTRIAQAGLTERHARALLPLCEDTQKLNHCLAHIIEKGLNVQESETYIATQLAPARRGGQRIAVIKDLRIFFNTVDKAVRTMRQAGLGVAATREEDGDSYRYTIIIPKSASQKRGKTSA